MTKKQLNYDTAYQELENIISALQSETLGLEELNAKMRRAFELLDFCKNRLRNIEEDFQSLQEEE